MQSPLMTRFNSRVYVHRTQSPLMMQYISRVYVHRTQSPLMTRYISRVHVHRKQSPLMTRYISRDHVHRTSPLMTLSLCKVPVHRNGRIIYVHRNGVHWWRLIFTTNYFYTIGFNICGNQNYGLSSRFCTVSTSRSLKKQLVCKKQNSSFNNCINE